MKRFIRWFGGMLAAASLSLSLGVSGATPALAAGTTVYIDDGVVPNGTVACPSPTVTTSLASVVVASSSTVILCPGDYTGTLAVTGVSNVKIIGKGAPVIHPGTGNILVSVTNSTNVTIQGLVVDGSLSLAPGFSSGISFANSSGTISNNTIIRMRQTVLTTACYGVGIQVDNAPGPVKILKNTITDFGCRGVSLSSETSVTVQSNAFWWNSSGGGISMAIGALNIQKLTISKNSIASNRSYLYGSGTRAFYIEDSPGAKISGNTITGVEMGFILVAHCASAIMTSDGMSISGNKIYESGLGILLDIWADSGSQCNPSINNLAIKSNQIISTLPLGYEAIMTSSSDSSATFDPQVQGMKITSNQYANYTGIYQSPSGPGIQDPPAQNSGNKAVMPPLGY